MLWSWLVCPRWLTRLLLVWHAISRCCAPSCPLPLTRCTSVCAYVCVTCFPNNCCWTHLLHEWYSFIIWVYVQRVFIHALQPGWRPATLFFVGHLSQWRNRAAACRWKHALAHTQISDVSVDTSGLEHELSEINTDHTTGLPLPPPVRRFTKNRETHKHVSAHTFCEL